MNRLSAILAADRNFERLARAYTLAGLPLPSGRDSFVAAALAAGQFRAQEVLEAYRLPARTDDLIVRSQRAQVDRARPARRAAEPAILSWIAL